MEKADLLISRMEDLAKKAVKIGCAASRFLTPAEAHGVSEHFMHKRVNPFVGSGRVLPENEEMVRLRREVKDLREENEILKKAAAYFAKNQR